MMPFLLFSNFVSFLSDFYWAQCVIYRLIESRVDTKKVQFQDLRSDRFGLFEAYKNLEKVKIL